MSPSETRLPRLVGLCGYMGSGKTTVARIMAARGYEIYGFADALKELAGRVGWDGTKRPAWFYEERGHPGCYNGRLLLQELGVGARDILGPDVWIDALFRRLLAEDPRRAVIMDVRFTNEAAAIRAAGGIVLRVHREGHDGDGHASELEVEHIPVDGVIVNDDFAALARKVVAALRSCVAP